MSTAVAAFPFPALDVTVLVVLVKLPVVDPAVTVTLNEQEAPPARVPPVSVIVGVVNDSVPPLQAGVAAKEVTETPGGVSVKPMPVSAAVAFGFEMVKLSVEVPPEGTVDGVKDLVMTGGKVAGDSDAFHVASIVPPLASQDSALVMLAARPKQPPLPIRTPLVCVTKIAWYGVEGLELPV